MDECSRTSALAMDLLAHQVPLTLLIDLVDPDGPNSREILVSERKLVQVCVPFPRQEDHYLPWQRRRPSA